MVNLFFQYQESQFNLLETHQALKGIAVYYVVLRVTDKIYSASAIVTFIFKDA